MSKIKFLSLFSSAISVLLTANTSFAIDGQPQGSTPQLSAFSYGVVEKQNDGSPNELRYLVYDGNLSLVSDTEFGKRNDYQAHGNYLGNGWQYAIIKIIDNHYNWIIKENPDPIVFGENSDLAITGCDFNGDSLTDLSFLRGNSLYFRTVKDPTITETPLRMVDLDSLIDLTCGDLNGDGIDDIATLTPVPDVKNKYFLIVYDTVSGRQIFNKVVKRANQIIITDYNNDKRNDLGLSRSKQILNKKPNQIIYHRNLKLRSRVINTSNFSEMTSYFDQDENGPATILLKNGTRVSAIDPVNKSKLWTTRTKSNYSLLRKTHFYMPIPPQEDPEGNDICSEILPANDGVEGFLWKGSDHDGRIVVLLPSKYRNFNEVSIMKGNEVLEDLYFSARANGNRQHWRGRNYPANFPNNSLVVAKRPKKTVCWLVENTAVRND